LDVPFDPRALQASRVGFFGGTFDPPHAGHLFVVREAARAHALEHVVWTPARRSPHKESQATPGAVRAELVELALLDGELSELCSVWRGELERPEPSYTVDSLVELARLREEAGRAGGLSLVLGADQLQAIERWHDVPRIFELAEPVILARSGAGRELEELRRRLVACAAAGELDEALTKRLIEAFVDPGRVDVAATDLRERIDGEGLTQSVRRRIDELGLYR